MSPPCPTISIKDHCMGLTGNQQNIFPNLLSQVNWRNILDWFQVCKPGFRHHVMTFTAFYNLEVIKPKFCSYGSQMVKTTLYSLSLLKQFRLLQPFLFLLWLCLGEHLKRFSFQRKVRKTLTHGRYLGIQRIWNKSPCILLTLLS